MKRLIHKVLFFIYGTALMLGALMALNEDPWDEPQRWEINLIGFLILFAVWPLLKKCAVRAFDPEFWEDK